MGRVLPRYDYRASMRALYIAGAGGCGREVFEIAKAILASSTPDWQLAGFLDDCPTEDLAVGGSPVVVGSIHGWCPSEHDLVSIAIGDPLTRSQVCDHLLGRGAQLATLVHPSAYVSESSTISPGAVIYPLAQISTNATVGQNTLVNFCVSVGHDVEISSSCVINSHVALNGGVVVGSRVMLGSHSVIAPKVKIGDDAFVGAGSSVIVNVSDGQKVMGVPARTWRL